MSRGNKKHRRKNIEIGICFSLAAGASSSPLRNAVFTFSGVFWQRFWQAPIIRMEIFRHTGSIKVYCTFCTGSDGVVFHKSHTIKNAFRSIFENWALTCYRANCQRGPVISSPDSPNINLRNNLHMTHRATNTCAPENLDITSESSLAHQNFAIYLDS